MGELALRLLGPLRGFEGALLQFADRVLKEGMLLTLHGVIGIDSEKTSPLGSSVYKGQRQEEWQRSELTLVISRSPCLRTSSSRWEPGGAVIRPPTLKALRIALIW